MATMIEKIIDNYHIIIFKDKSELSIKVSDYISEIIKINLNAKDRFQFCVCGGSTPKNIYDLLSKKKLNWDKVDVFLGDERCVKPNSEESNTLMINNSLLNNYGSKADFYNIFSDEKINEDISIQLLLEELKKKCDGNPPTFDFTLLGLGNDGHTASLFPNNNNNTDEIVITSFGNGLKRISFTPKVLSASRKIAFVVSGSSKQIALKRLISNSESSDRTPAKLIKSKSKIIVFSDLEASKDLDL
tara:strand:- start:4 stop:738 length:735 start_codon:yes stop_codon:yes gene_type:complete